MSQDLNDMTDAELADWQYAHRDDLESEEGEPVEGGQKTAGASAPTPAGSKRSSV